MSKLSTQIGLSVAAISLGMTVLGCSSTPNAQANVKVDAEAHKNLGSNLARQGAS
jgi:hypothetical protein